MLSLVYCCIFLMVSCSCSAATLSCGVAFGFSFTSFGDETLAVLSVLSLLVLELVMLLGFEVLLAFLGVDVPFVIALLVPVAALLRSAFFAGLLLPLP